MAEHTPGPWSSLKEGDPRAGMVSGIYVGPTEDCPVAFVFDDPYGGWPDARLIAAAPDLLAACEQALGRLLTKSWAEQSALDTAQTLNKAIAKARGEEA